MLSTDQALHEVRLGSSSRRSATDCNGKAEASRLLEELLADGGPSRTESSRVSAQARGVALLDALERTFSARAAVDGTRIVWRPTTSGIFAVFSIRKARWCARIYKKWHSVSSYILLMVRAWLRSRRDSEGASH